MNSIIIEEAIDMIRDDIFKELDHILNMLRDNIIDYDMYDALKPPRGLTKYIHRNNLNERNSFENDMNQWVACINKHSEITIPSGIHANVMRLYELTMDAFHAKYGYRKVIKHVYTSKRFPIIMFGMIIDLKSRVLKTDYDICRSIFDALDNISNSTVDIYTFIDGIQKCMSISTQHADITKPAGMHAEIEIIYRYILNVMVIPELHEDIASTVFSPKRVQRMIATYGMDWIDEV